MGNYRLAPKPGLIRVNKFVDSKMTVVKPQIQIHHKELNNKPNKPIKSIPSIKNDKSPIITPAKPVNQIAKIKPNQIQNRGVKNRNSNLKNQKELEFNKTKEKIIQLKNCGVGRVLVIAACGPSILEADLPKLKNHPLIDIMSINKPDPRLYPTKYWAFCDQSQYKENSELFHSYNGVLINTWSIHARHRNQVLVKNRQGEGFSKDLISGYYIGRSTTYANMQTALWMNYDKIYIFGCDMGRIPGNDNLHFYGRNKSVDPKIRESRFKNEAEFQLKGAKLLTIQEREKFVFCSAYNNWPFIDYYTKLDHKLAVNHILESLNSK